MGHYNIPFHTNSSDFIVFSVTLLPTINTKFTSSSLPQYYHRILCYMAVTTISKSVRLRFINFSTKADLLEQYSEPIQFKLFPQPTSHNSPFIQTPAFSHGLQRFRDQLSATYSHPSLRSNFDLHNRWRSWLRHCATSRKAAGSIPDGIIGIFL